MAAERARPHSQRVGGSDLRLGSSTAVPVDAGTLLLTCEAASKTVCGGRSISSLNGDLGPMVVFFDRLLRLHPVPPLDGAKVSPFPVEVHKHS